MEKETAEEIIHPKDFYDIFATLKIPIREQNKKFTCWWVIASLGIISVCCLSLAMAYDKISLFQFLLGAVAIPLWMGSYLFFPITIANVFNKLWTSGIIGSPNKNAPKGLTYQGETVKLSRQIHSSWVNIVGLTIIALFWLYEWYTPFKPGIHRTLLWNVHWTLILLLCLYTFTTYIATLCLARLLLVVISIYRVFYLFTINVFPWHPDGSGGLGMLRSLLWMSQTMFLACLCFVISLSSRTTDHVYALVLLVGYLIVFPAMLVVWLGLAHREMVRTRNRYLQAIANELDKTIQATGASIAEPTEIIVKGSERLAALQKHYDQVKESFPIWPLWITMIKRLGPTLVLPLLTSLVPAIIYMLIKLME